MRELTEDQWLRTVTDLAHAYGWLDYHVDRSAKRVIRRSGAAVWVTNVSRQGKGFPDLVLVHERDRRLIFAELKRDHDTHTYPEQREWLRILGLVAEVHLWRPRDYDDVERTLRPSEK